MPPPLTVVLIHWNQPQRCVATVAAFRVQGLPLRITIVDNGSAAAALAELRAAFADDPDVELVETGRNLGFGAGANVGLRRWLAGGSGSWVAVAPHDALPLPGCLAAVLAAVQDRPRAGLACADVGDGHIPVVDPYFGGMTVAAGGTPGWQDAGYPHGTLLLAARACLEDIGLFDERYFSYCEEADLGVRARRAGWEVGLVRGADVRNPYLGGGAAAVDYLMLRNTLLLVRDHFGRYHAFIRFVIALLQLAQGVVRPARRPWIFAPAARVRALLDFTRGRFGPPPSAVTRRAGVAPPAASGARRQ